MSERRRSLGGRIGRIRLQQQLRSSLVGRRVEALEEIQNSDGRNDDLLVLFLRNGSPGRVLRGYRKDVAAAERALRALAAIPGRVSDATLEMLREHSADDSVRVCAKRLLQERKRDAEWSRWTEWELLREFAEQDEHGKRLILGLLETRATAASAVPLSEMLCRCAPGGVHTSHLLAVIESVADPAMIPNIVSWTRRWNDPRGAAMLAKMGTPGAAALVTLFTEGEHYVAPYVARTSGTPVFETIAAVFRARWSSLPSTPHHGDASWNSFVHAFEILADARALPLLHGILRRYWKVEHWDGAADYNQMLDLMSPVLHCLGDFGDESSVAVLLELGLDYDSASELERALERMLDRVVTCVDDQSLSMLATCSIGGSVLKGDGKAAMWFVDVHECRRIRAIAEEELRRRARTTKSINLQ